MGLDYVELILALEAEFGIKIEEKDCQNMLTVGDTFEYLKIRLESSPPAHCAKQKFFSVLETRL